MLPKLFCRWTGGDAQIMSSGEEGADWAFFLFFFFPLFVFLFPLFVCPDNHGGEAHLMSLQPSAVVLSKAVRESFNGQAQGDPLSFPLHSIVLSSEAG